VVRDLRRTLGVVPVERDVVRVSGPDAVSYLQGQLSQDVEDLDVGATTWSFVLQPSGKVDVWCRVTRTGGDGYLLDADGGTGEKLVARLRRFLLRTKAEVEPLRGWRALALRGPGADDAAARVPVEAELRAPAGWPAVEGADLLGPEVRMAVELAEHAVDEADYQALRIRSGVPATGAELTDRTIPAEAGQWIIDASVDFTKGCFTGQELVARIDSRGGNVPRRLRGLVVAAGAGGGPPAGAAVLVDGDEVGTVTSSAVAPDPGDGAIALAYIARAVEPPADATLRWADGEAAAVVRSLPLD
jgi:folate-binding protein YgfZ